MTPYYDEDGITIWHGDCREVLPTLTGVGLVVTSPPYNLGTNIWNRGMHAGSFAAKGLADGYDSHEDAMSAAEYDEWQAEMVRLMWATLADDGAIFYNHKPRIQGGIAKLPTDYGAGLPLRQIIIWDRGYGFNFSHTHFLPKSEWIVIWARPAWQLVSRSASQVGDVWRFPPEMAGGHPAPFPVGLPARAIAACAPRLVLDPFCGSGTTLRAAADAGIRAIGCDTSERYCEMAAKRLAQGALAFDA